MPKYEIMLIVDPKELTQAETMAKEILGANANITKLEKTELAYEINGTKIANYLLIDVTTTGAIVKEFIRRANISKNIWRHLVVNLDSERAMDTMNAEPKRRAFDREERKPFNREERRPYNPDRKPFVKNDANSAPKKEA